MSVMRGTVTKMEGRKPHVEVPDLGVGYDFGPCETATGGQVLQVGQRVLVCSVSGIPEDVVVIGILDTDAFDLGLGSPASSAITARFDARYYTEAEVDQKLARKVNVPDSAQP